MEITANYEKLIEKLRKHTPDIDVSLLERAYHLADESHQNQKRKSGEPFVIHPVAVASMLADMEMDLPSIIAGMLHEDRKSVV